MATSIKLKTRILLALLLIGMVGSVFTGSHLSRIEQFNQAAATGGKVDAKTYPFEAKYATAYWLAKQGRYQDAIQLFGQLLEMGSTPENIAAVHYNLGNIFMIRGLLVNHNGSTVQDEAEYLLNQARLAFTQSLKQDQSHMDVKYNLDWVLSLLPDAPGPEELDEKLGIVMGNMPTGLP